MKFRWNRSASRLLPVAALAGLLALAATAAQALAIKVRTQDGRPLGLVMVTQSPLKPAVMDDSDNGYPASGKPQQGAFEHTRFTDARGVATLPDSRAGFALRLRKPGYQDLNLTSKDLKNPAVLTLKTETDVRALAEQRPSNAWTATLGKAIPDEAIRKEFLLHCGFCHQQGSALLRRERSAEEWETTIKRMVRYGARLSSQAQKELPALLEKHWKDVNSHPELVPASTPWGGHLAGAQITELPLGDRFSQMHDFILHSNGMVYVGDNLQDRLYEVNPDTGAYTVYKIPPVPGDQLGGLLAGRLRDFPKHETYQGIHSLAESKKDGHVFITPSYQRRLLEFDPVRKSFTAHEMDSGFYPHTVRIDAKDRVWFTLALSNQVAMFDRSTDKFSTYDLPFRNFMEKLTVRLTPFFFKLIGWGLPITNWVRIDHVSTGVPLPYGIDITPDGMVWIARLHTDEIASINPNNGQVTMIPTPLHGPRRLRSDRDGNLWIVMFNESAILRYEPANGKFTTFELPVVPKGSETPYSLNVDRTRHQVWVTGTNSDSAQCLDIASGTWRFYPLPRKATFTRDIEFGRDGRVILSSASFPSWHIEDAQPTLIQLQPGPAKKQP
jgi:streptogramin lyase